MIARELHKLLKEDIKDAVTTHFNQTDDEIIGVDEVAQMLGIKPKTVYNKVNKLPHTKVGRSLRFSRNRISEFIRSPLSANF